MLIQLFYLYIFHMVLIVLKLPSIKAGVTVITYQIKETYNITAIKLVCFIVLVLCINVVTLLIM